MPTLSARATEQVRKAVRNDKRRRLARPAPTPTGTYFTILLAKTPSGGIPARSGTTAGSASCDVFKLVSTTLTDTTNNETIYNVSDQPVPGDTYVMATQELVGGQWIATSHDAG